MPNWASGTLKIRGKRKNIEEFVRNEFYIGKYENVDGEMKWIKELVRIEKINEEEITFEEEINDIWLSNIIRAYVNVNSKYLSIYGTPNWDSPKAIIVLDINIAWGITIEMLNKLVRYAKKYSLDIKIVTYECGNEFRQDTEIIDGKIVTFKETKYNDYMWEADFPTIGG